MPLSGFASSNARMKANADKDTALLASPAEAAQAADTLLRERYNFVPLDQAEQIIALGGDGYLLHTLRERLNVGKVCPVFGMNRGTVGFLMNDWRIDGLIGVNAISFELSGRIGPFAERL